MEPQKRQTKETDKSNNKLNCRRCMWCSNYAWIPRKQIWGGSDDEITTLLSTTANHKSHHTNWYFSKTPNGCNVQSITRPRACKKLKSCGLGAFGSSKSASALGKDQNSWVVMLKRRHHKFYIKNGHFPAWNTWIFVESGQKSPTFGGGFHPLLWQSLWQECASCVFFPIIKVNSFSFI